MKRRPSINYVNNEEFYNLLVEWKESGVEQMPDKIARIVLKICTNLMKSGKFSGYTWRSAMEQDAIFSCVKFAKNFDPEKSKNPFAFFTMIAYNAAIKRITMEKARLAAMDEYKEHLTTLYDIQPDADGDSDDSNKYGSIESTAKRINRTFARQKKVKKKVQTTIDDFFNMPPEEQI